jgi:hypothetical protein
MPTASGHKMECSRCSVKLELYWDNNKRYPVTPTDRRGASLCLSTVFFGFLYPLLMSLA